MVYCENTGDLVYTKAIHRKMNPEGAVKLMTALVASQHLQLDKNITISKAVAEKAEKRDAGYSVAGLKRGDSCTGKQLLIGMLKNGSDDAAYQLALSVSGSEAAFVRLMNRTAKDIGCTGTVFRSSSGMERGEKSRTTVHDLLMISRVALANETIASAMDSSEYTLPKKNGGKVVWKNNSFSKMEKLAGIYACLQSGSKNASAVIAAYQKNGLKLYFVFLGEPSRSVNTDIRTGISLGKMKVKGIKAVRAGVKKGRVHIAHGEKTQTDVYTSRDGYAYIPKEGSRSLVKTKTSISRDIKAPVKSGDRVGYEIIYVGEEVVNKVPLVVKENIDEGWFPSYLGISNDAALIILIVIMLFLVLLLVVLLLRYSARQKKKKDRRDRIRRMAAEELEEEEERRKRGWYF